LNKYFQVSKVKIVRRSWLASVNCRVMLHLLDN